MALTLQPDCPIQPLNFMAPNLCKSCAHSYICSQAQIISQISSAIFAYFNDFMSTWHQALVSIAADSKMKRHQSYAWPALRMNRLNLGDKD